MTPPLTQRATTSDQGAGQSAESRVHQFSSSTAIRELDRLQRAECTGLASDTTSDQGAGQRAESRMHRLSSSTAIMELHRLHRAECTGLAPRQD
jgi:hypothetical protein